MRELHRTNVSLLLDDAIWLEAHFGRGWTNIVREIIHDYIVERKAKTDVADHHSVEGSPDE
jgi:hypothetical protein